MEGVSTRKVKEDNGRALRHLLLQEPRLFTGRTFGRGTPSVEERRLEAAAYPYLFVDARYEKARVDRRVVSQGVLVVSAVRAPEGWREILAVEVADTESEATYQELFRSLKGRGLRGVELVLCDEHAGLKSGDRAPLPGGLSAELPGPLREEPPRHGGHCQAQGARRGPARIFAAPAALRSPPRWARNGARRARQKVSGHLEEHVEECLAAWLSRATEGASAPPTAWRGSTRS